MVMLWPVVELMLSFPWVRKDWPKIDASVLARLCDFVTRHWGGTEGGRLVAIAPLEYLEADCV